MVPSDAIFSCTAASIKFLVDQGFDLNTWVRHGVPYMPLATRDKAMHQVQNHLETTSGAEAAQLDETQQPQPQQQQQQQQKAARSKASAAAQELTSPSLHSQSGLRGSQQEVEALIEKLGQVERWLESAAAGYAALRPHQQQPQAQQWAMTSERGATQLQVGGWVGEGGEGMSSQSVSGHKHPMYNTQFIYVVQRSTTVCMCRIDAGPVIMIIMC
jgi:hypothetical protein